MAAVVLLVFTQSFPSPGKLTMVGTSKLGLRECKTPTADFVGFASY